MDTLITQFKEGCMNMKKQLKLLVVLLTIILSTFNFAFRTLFQSVNATYVEGPIMQDTFWTLVDSPFVLSNNVTVGPGVTLTIEPGVEVMFGENFWLIVNGRIVANGVEDKMIRFTSNKLAPDKGDWETILISGTQTSSFIYCIIEYGTNGITVENGYLNIENSFVRSNSQNGITINSGNAVVKNNEITDNTMDGIHIAGGNQILIQNNVISSNDDGIFLTGHLVGVINIEQNEILLNEQSGIVLEADAYDNTIITKNAVSENLNGFRVSTNTGTYITSNYVSDNTVGIYYETGQNHEAHFNDIYGNNLGMDVADATVNATNNYWGHSSGPFHKSLNPHGKGDPVGGNGVNLDFTFFLSAPIDYNNEQPTAILWADKILVAPNQNITFVGADSYDDGRVDQYFFDFGDGNNSGWTTLSLFNHTYSSNGTYIARLTVIDDFAVTSNVATTTIGVQDIPALEASITLSNYSVNYNEEVLVTVYVSDGGVAVENANVTLFSVKGGSFTPLSGLTDSTGYFTATFTAPNVTEITNVRIIARAAKTGYADGAGYEYLEVIPFLTVQVITEPTIVKSEETATVTVYVTGSFEEPVADAPVVLSVDYGNLSATSGVTDLNGRAIFSFIAPQTLNQINVTIVATATKTGYAEGHGQTIIVVEPKTLVVEITAEPIATISEAKINVTAQVTYDTVPIPEANVTITSENLPTTTGLTNPYGYTTFILTAPPVNVPLNITIIARASKAGYADGEKQLDITVNPGVLNVEVRVDPSTVMSEESAVVTVYVTCNATPVANASITVSSSQGTLSNATGFTDANGYCTFTYNAPKTTEQIPLIVITANATKNGYTSGEYQTTVTVTPETGGGWPLTTILLILIPIAIVVIVVVLIKFKIIAVSSREEE
jgi:parallel beta-helix repeat protein